jgi:hypothetical protein
MYSWLHRHVVEAPEVATVTVELGDETAGQRCFDDSDRRWIAGLGLIQVGNTAEAALPVLIGEAEQEPSPGDTPQVVRRGAPERTHAAISRHEPPQTLQMMTIAPRRPCRSAGRYIGPYG